MFPWAVIFDRPLWFGPLEMRAFIVILVLGYDYACQRGALEWT
jgi:NADH:ubiquinone oxidoreductase subunit 3 (subunit A)